MYFFALFFYDCERESFLWTAHTPAEEAKHGAGGYCNLICAIFKHFCPCKAQKCVICLYHKLMSPFYADRGS